MKLLEKYNDIVLRYRNGDFCSENLTMGKILEIAGEPDLFEKMDLSEIQFLIDASTGFTKSMFYTIKEQKIKKIQKMAIAKANQKIPWFKPWEDVNKEKAEAKLKEINDEC